MQREHISCAAERIVFALLTVLMLLIMGAGVLCWVCALGQRQFWLILPGLFLGFAGGALFVRLYLPGIARRMTGALLFPERYLSAPPPVLSPAEGLIRRGELEQAEELLQLIRKTHPAHARTALLLLQVLSQQGRYADALETAESYFAQPRRSRYAEEDLPMLLLAADAARSCAALPRAWQLLKREAGSSRCPEGEKRKLQLRIAALEEETQTEA